MKLSSRMLTIIQLLQKAASYKEPDDQIQGYLIGVANDLLSKAYVKTAQRGFDYDNPLDRSNFIIRFKRQLQLECTLLLRSLKSSQWIQDKFQKFSDKTLQKILRDGLEGLYPFALDDLLDIISTVIACIREHKEIHPELKTLEDIVWDVFNSRPYALMALELLLHEKVISILEEKPYLAKKIIKNFLTAKKVLEQKGIILRFLRGLDQLKEELKSYSGFGLSEEERAKLINVLDYIIPEVEFYV